MKQHPPHPSNQHVHMKAPIAAPPNMRLKKPKGGVPPYFYYAPPGFTGGRHASALNSSNYYMGTIESTGSIRDVWGHQRPNNPNNSR